MTEICLCNVCSCHEMILRRHGREQKEETARIVAENHRHWRCEMCDKQFYNNDAYDGEILMSS